MIDDRQTVLSHFSLRFSDLEERLAAAQAADFGAIGLWTQAFADAERSGLDAATQRGLVERAGLAVTEIEAVRPFPTGDEDDRALVAEREATAFRMADTFGCRYVQTVGPYQGSFDDGVEVFAGFCDRAAEHGLVVGIEFLPFTNITDAGIAADLVVAADRPNGGVCVDSWHHFRGAASDDLLRRIPAPRVMAVQIDDGTLRPTLEDYYTDCLTNRVAPGDGEFDLVRFIRLLDDMGVSVPVSLEVISSEYQRRPASEAATVIHEGYRRLLASVHEARGVRLDADLTD